MRAVVGVVDAKPFADFAGFHANGSVVAGIVAGGAAEDFDADGAFLENVGVALQGVLDDVAQEVLAALAGTEFVAGEDTVQLLANLLFRWTRAVFPVCATWSRTFGRETSNEFPRF